jgi:hypothetical protein
MHYPSTQNPSMHSPFPLDVLPFDLLPFNAPFNTPPSTHSPSACSSHSLHICTCRMPCAASTRTCTQNTPCRVDTQPRRMHHMQEALVNVQPRCPHACRTPSMTRSLDTHTVCRMPLSTHACTQDALKHAGHASRMPSSTHVCTGTLLQRFTHL